MKNRVEILRKEPREEEKDKFWVRQEGSEYYAEIRIVETKLGKGAILQGKSENGKTMAYHPEKLKTIAEEIERRER